MRSRSGVRGNANSMVQLSMTTIYCLLIYYFMLQYIYERDSVHDCEYKWRKRISLFSISIYF